MNHAKIKIKEEDMFKLILEFFSSRSLHVSMRTLEKETGIVNNSYSDDILFLRELILDGDWDEVLLFAQPFENIEEFNSKQFKYLILKQKFIELLSVKSHLVGKQSTNAIEEVMQTLNKLEETCPSKEEYSNLCWLLTVPNLIERNEFREWTLDNSRLKCFTLALEEIGSVISPERKTKKNTSCANKGRLLQLIAKGLLYETCIELCQVKATGNDNESFGDVCVRANVLHGIGDEYTANLFSWLRSLSHQAFNRPFEQLSLEVFLEKLNRYQSNPRHSVDLALKDYKQKSTFSDQMFKSLDNFDKLLLSRKKIKSHKENPVNEPTFMNSNNMKSVNQERIGTDGKHERGKILTDTKNSEKDGLTSNILSHQENSEPITKFNVLKTAEPDKVSSSKEEIKDKKIIPDSMPSAKAKDLKETSSTDNDLAFETPEKDFHVEKEKQRASVLQKLKEYESRKQLMHNMIQKQQEEIKFDTHSKNGNGNDLHCKKERKEKSHLNSIGKVTSDQLTPRKNVNVISLADGSGKISTSTPKPAKKNMTETPPPEASPVGHANGESANLRFATNKEARKCNISALHFNDEHVKLLGKENEPKDAEINRKGPMINGVRRALSSPPQLIQPPEEPVFKPDEKQAALTKNKNKPRFKAEAVVNNLETAADVEKRGVKQNDHVPIAKGPGPKIKTRDGSKVYVTELLKSREEIKNASASNQRQEAPEQSESVEISKGSENKELIDVNDSLSFSPVCMLEDSQAIRAVCFHPDGRLFAVGANSKILRVCTVESYDSVLTNSNEQLPQPAIVFKRNKYHKGSIYCMAWNPLGDIIATGSNDKSIKLLRFDPDSYVQEGNENDLAIHNGTVRELAFVPDKAAILVSGGAGDGAVQITDCSTCQTIGTLRGHSGNVMSVYAGYGDIIATGSTDNTLRLWDLRSHRCIDVILVGDSSPASAALSADGSYLASGQEDGCILLYDISAGRTLQSFRLHQEDCRSVRFSPDSQYLLTGSYDTDISLLHANGNLELTVPRHYKVASHKDKVIQCRWHPTRHAFLSSSADRTVVLWSSGLHKSLHLS